MKDLTVSQVAKMAGCHPRTVYNYEGKGVIKPVRDVNGYRRFSIEDAEKLKRILSARWPTREQINANI